MVPSIPGLPHCLQPRHVKSGLNVWLTAEAVAAIEPADATGRKMIREITKLPMRQQMRAFQEGEVFRLLAQLNPSLLRALELCHWHEPVPETPRSE